MLPLICWDLRSAAITVPPHEPVQAVQSRTSAAQTTTDPRQELQKHRPSLTRDNPVAWDLKSQTQGVAGFCDSWPYSVTFNMSKKQSMKMSSVSAVPSEAPGPTVKQLRDQLPHLVPLCALGSRHPVRHDYETG
jgi:hypothetical protein